MARSFDPSAHLSRSEIDRTGVRLTTTERTAVVTPVVDRLIHPQVTEQPIHIIGVPERTRRELGAAVASIEVTSAASPVFGKPPPHSPIGAATCNRAGDP